MDFSLRQLEYFLAVVDQRTMSAAAEHLHISQSAVSVAVANLERALEVQLFVRSTRGLALTNPGRSVLADARRLLDQAEEMQTDARSHGGQLAGRLVIGCIPALTQHLVPTVLREFPTRHPDVEIDLLEGRADEIREWLLDGRCEVGLTYALGPAQPVRWITLYASDPHVLLPPGHRLAGCTAVTLAELQDDPLILLNAPAAATYFTELFHAAGIVPRPRYLTTGMASARALVAAGAGYTLEMHHPGTPGDTVPVAHDGDPLNVVLALPERTRLTRRASAFLTFAQQSLTPAR
jgi:DNA-binding transcriptional LysR family regulator